MASTPLYGSMHGPYVDHLPQKISIDKELLKLMRESRNRRCCDCDAELTDYRNIWASVQVGCFVCVNCKQVHEALHLKPPLQCKSVNMDAWTEAELEKVKSMGNARVNETYERYIPSSWVKPTPDADHYVIEQWIRAKYEKHHFMVPHYKDEGATAYARPTSMSQTLPIRLVDYFVVLGLGAMQIENTRSPITPFSTPEEVYFRADVLDCFPEADTHLGCPLPEHIGQFAFPEGLTLRSSEHTPLSLQFVLTNVSGVKMYGVSLTVFEEVDKSLLQQAVSEGIATPGYNNVKPDFSLSQLPGWLKDAVSNTSTATDMGLAPSLHCPKALLLLSHYPFYHVYSQFLQQLYRISLSEAPVPIERFISNFVCEVPLPPQGNVEVTYALPDRTLILKRPPKNRLPLVDFSYRPLFVSLSVDNVLTLFSCLLVEAKVVLCSSYWAVLNPVAEALLSLLFPLVWQGAYIPVMPVSMLDMLEAPVPFLVGIKSDYLREVPPEQRPQGIVFVDLDNDIIHLGTDEEKSRQNNPVARRLPHMPDRETAKLRSKLLESAGVVHRSHIKTEKVLPGTVLGGTPGDRDLGATGAGNTNLNAGGGAVVWGIDKADLAFPSNEHLLPLSTFATEQGLHVPLQPQTAAGGGLKARIQSLYPRKSPRPPQDSKGLVDAKQLSILDARNNCDAPDGLGFNAHEIRGAFLRFFVSIFRNYKDYMPIVSPTDPFPKELFHREAFLRDVPAPCLEFMNSFLQSQMFERFLEEQVAHPMQPEIRFFEESIIQKLNRSKKMSKKDTPFLNDTSDEHNQTFNPPPPSNWGLPDDGSLYTYHTFPRLKKDRYGNVRWARRLFKTPDQHRNVSSVNHQKMVNRSKRLVMRKREQSIVSIQREEQMKKHDMDVEHVIKSISSAQKLWKRHKAHRLFLQRKAAKTVLIRALRRRLATREDRSKYLQTIAYVCTIQRACRRWHTIKRDRLFLEWIVAVQASFRGRRQRKRYLAGRKATVMLQARARCRQCCTAYAIIRQMVILCQAVVRGWFKRRVAALERQRRLSALRSHVFALWKRAYRPLLHRAKFWVLFQGEGFLDLAVHEDEALLLWRDLGLIEQDKEFLTRMKFSQTFVYAEAWLETTSHTLAANTHSTAPNTTSSTPTRASLWKKRPISMHSFSARSPMTHTNGDNNAETNSNNDQTLEGHKGLALSRSALAALGLRRSSVPLSSVQELPHLQVAKRNLGEERDSLYHELKHSTDKATEGMRASLFITFGLEKQKKRKHKLVNVLFEDLNLAGASAEMVLSLSQALGAEARGAWVRNRRDARIRADLLCTVQACISSIQVLKRHEWEAKKLSQEQTTSAIRVLLPLTPTSTFQSDESSVANASNMWSSPRNSVTSMHRTSVTSTSLERKGSSTANSAMPRGSVTEIMPPPAYRPPMPPRG